MVESASKQKYSSQHLQLFEIQLGFCSTLRSTFIIVKSPYRLEHIQLSHRIRKKPYPKATVHLKHKVIVVTKILRVSMKVVQQNATMCVIDNHFLIQFVWKISKLHLKY